MLVSYGIIKLLFFCLSCCVLCHSQVCIPTWTPYSRSFSVEGSPQSSVFLLQDCLARCERSNDCVAVDFDLSSTVHCWLHYDISDLTGDNFHEDAENNVTQYRITRNCTNYEKGPECPVQWIQNTDIGKYSGEPVNYWTEYDCFIYCLYSESCAAVYYNKATTPPCWIHKELDPNNAIDGDGVVQYQLNKTCPASASPSSFQIGRCVGQYFPKTGWCPAGTKIHIKEAWFKINPLCCYRNAEDAYPPDSSSLFSIEVSYLDKTFFNELNSSCEGQSDCQSSVRAKSYSALNRDQCLNGEGGTNFVSITYQCLSGEIKISAERTTGARRATATPTTRRATAAPTKARSTVQNINMTDVDKAALNNLITKDNSDRLIIGLVIGLGVPLILLVVIVIIVILIKRRKRKDADEPKESHGIDRFYHTTETIPRGAVPENEQNEISMTVDAP